MTLGFLSVYEVVTEQSRMVSLLMERKQRQYLNRYEMAVDASPSMVI